MRIVALVALLALPAHATPVSEVHYVMGTYLRIVADGQDSRPAMRRCFQEARRLERVFSRFDPASELTRLHAAGPGPQPVSPDMARLLRDAQALAEATDGTFDVTVGSVTEPVRTRASAGPRARSRIGAAHARLAGTMLTLDPGTRLDFDGIAKGYAVDICVGMLRSGGVRRALVSLGESSLYALGAPPGEDVWRIAVRGLDPAYVIARLDLRDQALSVSATYGATGRRGDAHIVDARSGRLLDTNAAAVVVSPSATEAEAYTKALLVWGAVGLDRVERQARGWALYIEPGGVRSGRAAVARGGLEIFTSPVSIPEHEVALW